MRHRRSFCPGWVVERAVLVYRSCAKRGKRIYPRTLTVRGRLCELRNA